VSAAERVGAGATAGADTQPWHYASAAAQAAALANGEVSAQALLEAALQRMDRFEPTLNALAVRDEARARAAAHAADVALARGERAPLLGVPVTVKESFDVAGLPTTTGDARHAALRADSDAPAVSALKRAGAIIVGKTNVPLANGDIQTFNDLHGLTRNPWDPARTPGGSSGGSATALAAGYVALELGSDIGGSVRIPAHFCGVSAHKPSYGIVPLLGSGAPPGRLVESDLACAGPMARDAHDLELALDLLVNADPRTREAWTLRLPPARRARLADFRVLLLPAHPLLQPSASAQHAIDVAAGRLADAGTQVSRHSPLLPDLVQSHKVYQQLLVGAGLGKRPSSFFEDARHAIAGLDPADDSFQAIRVRASLLGHREWLIANEARMQLRAQWRRLFEAFDVVVTPVSVSPAFAHDHSQPRDARHVHADGVEIPYLDLFVWVGLPTLAALPATVVPIAQDGSGLPLGIQVFGPFLEDRTPLRFAQLLQAGNGGFRVPPGYA
jgi:amidase